jgi:hypothetical protein
MKISRSVGMVSAWIVVMGLAFLGVYFFKAHNEQLPIRHLAYPEFMRDIDEALVASGEISGDSFAGKFVRSMGSASFVASLPADDPEARATLIEDLHNHQVTFSIVRPLVPDSIIAMLVSFVLPITFFLILITLGVRYLVQRLIGGPRPRTRGPRPSF